MEYAGIGATTMKITAIAPFVRKDQAGITELAAELPLAERHRWAAEATDALEEARQMPPGPERIDALKKAGRLRYLVDRQGLSFARRGRPPK
jgi:hypothetical protein